MKIRLGFVSNSSSSSFILGYGEIINMKKFKKYLKDNKIDIDPYDVVIQEKGTKYQDSYGVLTGGNNTDLTLPKNIIDGDVDAFIVEIGHNEGDEAFTTYDEDTGEYADLNYDLADNISFYNENEQKVIKLFNNKTLIRNGNVVFGAERNG